jgi:LPXTG-site transpeptidase (sortase) family protein
MDLRLDKKERNAHRTRQNGVRFGHITKFAGFMLTMVALFCAIFYPLASKGYEKQTNAYIASLPDYSHIIPPIPLVKGKPIHIDIPSVGISLPVIDGAYDANTQAWTVSHDKVQFDTSSVQPNNRDGNTFIYGHATTAVFGPLLKIQPDALAMITTDNGFVLTYKLTSHEVVDPTNTSVLNYSGPSRLMLQTCTGPTLSEFRQLFYFSYIEQARIPEKTVAPLPSNP